MKAIPLCALLAMALPFLTASAAEAPRAFAAVPLLNPRAVAVDRGGNLYVGDVDAHKVYRLTPTGQVSVLGPEIPDPIGIAVARDGAIHVADADANTIYRILPDGATTLPGKPSPAPAENSLSAPTSLALDSAGNAWITNNTSNTILKLSPAGATSVLAGKAGDAGNVDGPGAAARFGRPRGIAIDASGNLFVADETFSNIRKITPAGAVSTLAGSGTAGRADGMGKAASFGAPRALVVDAAGVVYVADTDNHVIRRITPAGVVTTFAGQAGERGKADGPAAAARFSEPRGIAVDAAGTIYVADTGNGAIRQITPAGVVSTIAAAVKP